MDYSYLENGKSLTLATERCTACGQCLEVCPHAVFARRDRRNLEIVARERCMECGACALNCPTQAISVRHGVGCAIAVYNSFKNGGRVDCGCGGNEIAGKGSSSCC